MKFGVQTVATPAAYRVVIGAHKICQGAPLVAGSGSRRGGSEALLWSIRQDSPPHTPRAASAHPVPATNDPRLPPRRAALLANRNSELDRQGTGTPLSAPARPSHPGLAAPGVPQPSEDGAARSALPESTRKPVSGESGSEGVSRRQTLGPWQSPAHAVPFPRTDSIRATRAKGFPMADARHRHQHPAGGATTAHAHHGGTHAGHRPEMFRDKFWLSLLLTLPVVFWSEHVQMLLGYRSPDFPGSAWIPPLLGTAVFGYGGWVFLQGAWRELRGRLPGMMTLISLAILVAFVFSWAVQIGLVQAGVLWWEVSTLVTIMLLGHWIEMRSIDQARGVLKELARLLPDSATRVTGDREERVPVEELRDGDVVLIRPGEGVRADGVVQRGQSEVNEAAITGESRPVKKREGDEIVGGTINGEGSLRVLVTRTGEKTRLSGIMRLVADAQASKSRAQHLADRAAQLLTGVALGAGTDVAVEAGHIVLVRWDPRDIPKIIDLSRATYRKMVQNLWWAAGYNVFAIPLAAGALAPWGVVLTPAVGAVPMSASTVIVAVNAQLLKRAAP